MRFLALFTALSALPWLIAGPVLIQTAQTHSEATAGLACAFLGIGMAVLATYLLWWEPRR